MISFFLSTIAVLAGIAALLAGTVVAVRAWTDRMREQDLVFLQLLTPKKESKQDKEVESEQFSTGKSFKDVVGIMDHLFQSLHSLYGKKFKHFLYGQPFFSVEYAALAGEILFFVVCPRKIAHLIEKQITSFYPDIIIDIVEDYNIFTNESVVASETLVPHKPWTSVYKTYEQLKSDPLNNITNAFSKLKVDEGAAIQFVLRPMKQGWQKKLQEEAKHLVNPKKHRGKWWNPVTWASSMFSVLTSGDEGIDLQSEKTTSERVSSQVEEYSKAVDSKAANPGFTTVIRVLTSAQSLSRARTLLEGVMAS